MSKVRIVQMLCPERHCVVATAYESPDGELIPEMTERLEERFRELCSMGANADCAICRSRNLHCEDAATIFTTMQEAEPALRELAAAH
jgi:hypothetical protein